VGEKSVTGSGNVVLANAPTITNPIITNINPGANFTLTQNSVAAITSEETGAVANTLYLKTGNLGIGTTSPGSKLDITTAGLGTTQTVSSGLALVNTTAAAAGAQQISPAIRWSGKGWKTDATAASQAVDFRSYVVPVQGAANPSGYLSFGSSINGGAYNDGQMVLTSGGNVGIGTTGPAEKLQISGGNILLSNQYSLRSLTSTAANTALIQIDSGDYNALYSPLSSTGLKIKSATGVDLVTVQNGGNLGLGTINPQNFLSVTPTQYSTGTASQSTNTITGSGTTFTSAMVGSQFVFADGTNAGTITALNSTTSLTVSTSQTVGSQAYKIGYTSLQVNSSGNVGIGTTAPSYLLDLSGSGAMAKVVGLEIGPWPRLESKMRLKKYGDKVKVLNQSFFKADFSDASHIYLYLFPAILDKLEPIFNQTLKSSTRVISCDFQFKGRTPSCCSG
jgi:hypothetical protein